MPPTHRLNRVRSFLAALAVLAGLSGHAAPVPVSFRWSPIPQAPEYEFQVANDVQPPALPDWRPAAVAGGLPSTPPGIVLDPAWADDTEGRLVVATVEASSLWGLTFTARVRACNPAGCSVDWAEGQFPIWRAPIRVPERFEIQEIAGSE